ncbi:MAG: thioesterase [Bacteroidetes bacterium CG2_30_32_10]|nr:MAG: thioesterase [Bacteroidetes bacterium CG2_30_32_10]
MYTAETIIRVRYSETDQMGYVYYGNYGQYYEVSRVEAMRNLGLPYKMVEEKGYIMPVVSMYVKYIKPAFYDDLLTLKTSIKELPNMRIKYDYEIFNEKKLLINYGETVHAFVKINVGKPFPAPEWLLEKLQPFF